MSLRPRSHFAARNQNSSYDHIVTYNTYGIDFNFDFEPKFCRCRSPGHEIALSLLFWGKHGDGDMGGGRICRSSARGWQTEQETDQTGGKICRQADGQHSWRLRGLG